MIVLDTSALVEFLVGADALAERVRAACVGERLAAPHAVDLECASTLRGLVRGKKLPADEGRRALRLLGVMPLRRFDHVPLVQRIWELRKNMWPYDAAYVALAESLGVELVTVDGKLTGVPGLRCEVRQLRGE
ncbi:type II toxin-antitoxin system VapC family toxin [Pseudonocardia asaccharolytica]|uniref:Ribonuclease VapC n=1 Tax=Pseudonocardia asaccharolytica DSM 44247 = NBRC 16224 TaxID=1123024 RepID=A0A511D1L5_9PSEU|nr:type II toxin-antitoxin system VapC family toxin [Pseudonocardia asaccharolytica]GEL18665.1 VapC ribonuclease [Pseudonocardia asaccharolytica DSM 44247 = NBRC 16224]